MYETIHFWEEKATQMAGVKGNGVMTAPDSYIEENVYSITTGFNERYVSSTSKGESACRRIFP
jgi:hypothetical protein